MMQGENGLKRILWSRMLNVSFLCTIFFLSNLLGDLQILANSVTMI